MAGKSGYAEFARLIQAQREAATGTRPTFAEACDIADQRWKIQALQLMDEEEKFAYKAKAHERINKPVWQPRKMAAPEEGLLDTSGSSSETVKKGARKTTRQKFKTFEDQLDHQPRIFYGTADVDAFRRKRTLDRDDIFQTLSWNLQPPRAQTVLQTRFTGLWVSLLPNVRASTIWGNEECVAGQVPLPAEIVIASFTYGGGLDGSSLRRFLVSVDGAADPALGAAMKEPDCRVGRGWLQERADGSRGFGAQAQPAMDVLLELSQLASGTKWIYVSANAYNNTLGALHWLRLLCLNVCGGVIPESLRASKFRTLDDLTAAVGALVAERSSLDLSKEAFTLSDVATSASADHCAAHGGRCAVASAAALLRAARVKVAQIGGGLAPPKEEEGGLQGLNFEIGNRPVLSMPQPAFTNLRNPVDSSTETLVADNGGAESTNSGRVDTMGVEEEEEEETFSTQRSAIFSKVFHDEPPFVLPRPAANTGCGDVAVPLREEVASVAPASGCGDVSEGVPSDDVAPYRPMGIGRGRSILKFKS